MAYISLESALNQCQPKAATTLRTNHNRALNSESPNYVYSQQAIDRIVEQTVRNPEHVIDQMISKMQKKS